MENTIKPTTAGKFDRAYHWSFQRQLGLKAFVPCGWGVACLIIALLTFVRWQSLLTKQAEATRQGFCLSRLSLVCPDLLGVAQLHRSGDEACFFGRANPLQQRLESSEHHLKELDQEAKATSDLWSLHKQMLDLSRRMVKGDLGSFHADVEAAAICSLVESAIHDRLTATEDTLAATARQGKRLAYGVLGCMLCGLIGVLVGTGQARSTDRKLIRFTEFMKARVDRPKRVRRQEDPPAVEDSGPVDGETDLMQEFKDKLAEQVSQLRLLASGDSYSEVAQIANWLFGAAGTFGFSQFTEPSQLLEAAAHGKNGDEVARLSLLIEQLADGLLINEGAST
jgi:HPt (histidine-containing phosphotransfer) domain-containing protein